MNHTVSFEDNGKTTTFFDKFQIKMTLLKIKFTLDEINNLSNMTLNFTKTKNMTLNYEVFIIH